jgi:hypothetical protein
VSRVFGKYSICSLDGKPAKNPPDSVLDLLLATGNSPDNGCPCTCLNRHGAMEQSGGGFRPVQPETALFEQKALTQSG